MMIIKSKDANLKSRVSIVIIIIIIIVRIF